MHLGVIIFSNENIAVNSAGISKTFVCTNDNYSTKTLHFIARERITCFMQQSDGAKLKLSSSHELFQVASAHTTPELSPLFSSFFGTRLLKTNTMHLRCT